MEFIQNFVTNYYVWIVIISLFIIFTLIGYLVDKKKKEQNNIKEEQQINNTNEISEEPVKENVEIEKPKTLDELISQSNISEVSNIKQEESLQEQTVEEENNVENSVNEEDVNLTQEEPLTINNDWQPVLEEENNSIIIGEEKEDSN